MKISLWPQFFLIVFIFSDDCVTSKAVDKKNDQPLLKLDKLGELSYQISVSSLEELSNFLRIAGDKKMTEARAILEGRTYMESSNFVVSYFPLTFWQKFISNNHHFWK